MGEDVDVDGFSIFFRKEKNFSANQTCLYYSKMSHDQQLLSFGFISLTRDGKPYKGSSVSSVSLPSASVINGFRQGVIEANPKSCCIFMHVIKKSHGKIVIIHVENIHMKSRRYGYISRRFRYVKTISFKRKQTDTLLILSLI